MGSFEKSYFTSFNRWHNEWYNFSMSRAVGETAPILIISSLVFITMVPSGPLDEFTILPLQIYT